MRMLLFAYAWAQHSATGRITHKQRGTSSCPAMWRRLYTPHPLSAITGCNGRRRSMWCRRVQAWLIAARHPLVHKWLESGRLHSCETLQGRAAV